VSTAEGWNSITLGEVCKFTGGNGFREELQGQKDGDYPFIKVSDMELPGNKKAIVEANNWIDEKTRIKEAFKAFPELSVVFAKVGAALLLNRRRILTRPTCIDNNMMAAVPSGIEPLFLYYVLSDIDFADFVQSGAVPSINQGQLSSILFVLPKPNEQAKIAEILSTVDRAIEQTEALIAKQQRIKTGLMQDLLTRGIDEHGNLRSEKTHQFKDSPVGRIPVEWEVMKLSGATSKLVTYGIVQPGGHIPDGVPFVQTKDLAQGLLCQDMMDRTSHGIHSAYQRSTIHTGDILIGIRASVGCVAEVPKELNNTNISRGIARLSPSSKLLGRYLFWIVQAIHIQKMIKMEIKGSTYPEITLPALRNIHISVPTQEEQYQIVQSLDSVATQIRQIEILLTKLRSLKTALMQDLLTGKKRVIALIVDREPKREGIDGLI